MAMRQMHELSVCQSLLTQATLVMNEHKAKSIERIVVLIGPLSGVEPALLERAFTVARADAGVPEAQLEIQIPPVRVKCNKCGQESTAKANRLVCAHCGGWRVNTIEGFEMILKRVVLLDLPGPVPAAVD
jgi:hydrogenase nickel incorporation protein HypA/HybF